MNVRESYSRALEQASLFVVVVARFIEIYSDEQQNCICRVSELIQGFERSALVKGYANFRQPIFRS